jgi:MraZ protein
VFVSGLKWEKVERRPIIRRSGINGVVEHMFLGKYQHTLDNKGRLTIPSRFRELLVTDGAYVTQGFDRNLMVYTVPAFDRIYERVNKMNVTDANARLLKRLVFSSAERVEVDKAGRILIPEHLRQSVDLKSEAYVVGAGDFFEIWAPEAWAEQMAQINDSEANTQRFALLDLST